MLLRWHASSTRRVVKPNQTCTERPRAFVRRWLLSEKKKFNKVNNILTKVTVGAVIDRSSAVQNKSVYGLQVVVPEQFPRQYYFKKKGTQKGHNTMIRIKYNA